MGKGKSKIREGTQEASKVLMFKSIFFNINNIREVEQLEKEKEHVDRYKLIHYTCNGNNYVTNCVG